MILKATGIMLIIMLIGMEQADPSGYKMTDSSYGHIAIALSFVLFVAWGILSVMLFYQKRMWRGYGAFLIAGSFLVIFYRNIVGFTFFLTYVANLMQLAGVIIFLQVARVLGIDQKK